MRALKRVVAIGTTVLAFILSGAWILAIATGKNRPLAPSSKSELSDLEERINSLENVEPFVVVDHQGKKIFSVDSSGLGTYATVFNSNQVGVASMSAIQEGGYFYLRSEDGLTGARITVDQTWTGLRFNQLVDEPETKDGVTKNVTRDVVRVELGRGEAGNYSLKFPSKSGGVIAGIGESKQGSGAIIIGNSSGNRRASIVVGEDSKGIIGIYNAKGNAIVALGEATGNAGGLLAIGDDKSEPRVKMGTKDNRYGVVMAFPTGFPYVPKSGLPGSYMLGCAGGPACVP